MNGDVAIYRLLSDYQFSTVLDIGSGSGKHDKIFIQHGKQVTAIDYGKSPYFIKGISIIGDFNSYQFDTAFDCVWCCHVLEHQLNINQFLCKIYAVLKDDGILAITVPPLKHQIVGGHVSLWNGGLLLYNLILAGFNCSEAKLVKEGYDISIIVRKSQVDIDDLVYDAGDIKRISSFLPKSIQLNGDSFNGDLVSINW